MLKTFTVPVVITVVFPYHHLDLGRIQGIHLPQFCHTVGSNNHTSLVHQSPAAHQLPVRSLIVLASSCSTIPLERPLLAVCLGHLYLSSVGRAAVNGCQPRPVRIYRPLWVKGCMLPTHCQRGGDRMRGQRGKDHNQEEGRERKTRNKIKSLRLFWYLRQSFDCLSLLSAFILNVHTGLLF